MDRPKNFPMTPEELAAYRSETDAVKAQSEALKRERVHDCAEADAKHERFMMLQARKAYQTEIHGVAINVLVSILTKDALRSIRDSDFSQTASKLDVGEVVDFSLIVGKRYVDELHKIGVSQKQLADFREQISAMTPPAAPDPLITPPPDSDPFDLDSDPDSTPASEE